MSDAIEVKGQASGAGKFTSLKETLKETLKGSQWSIYKDFSGRKHYQYQYNQEERTLLFRPVDMEGDPYRKKDIDIEDAVEYIINGELEPMFGHIDFKRFTKKEEENE